MPVHTWKSNFTAGEMTERLDGRVDIAKYVNGAHCLNNFVVQVQGGATRRPGTAYIAPTKGSAAFQPDAFDTPPDAFQLQEGETVARLIPFQFSTTQAYMLEVGHEYIRVYENRAQVEASPGVPYEIVTPYTADEVFDLRFTQSADVLYLAHPNHPPMKLIRLTSTPTFSLTAITFLPPPTVEIPVAGPVGLTLSALTGTAVTVAAGADFFLPSDVDRQIHYLAGRAVITAVASPISATAWVLDAFSTTTLPAGDWTLDGSPSAYAAPGREEPIFTTTTVTLHQDGWRAGDVGKYVILHEAVYQILSVQDARVVTVQLISLGTSSAEETNFNFGITLGATTGDTTANAADPLFVATDVDHYIKYAGGVAIITQVLSDSAANVTILSPFRDTALPAGNWTISGPPQAAAPGAWTLEGPAWSVDRGYPGAVTFFEQRLMYAGSLSDPDTIWGSVSGDYENFARGAKDDASLAFTLAANQVNQIRWLKAQRLLLAGTVGGEFSLAGAQGGALTPTSVNAKPEAAHGSDYHVDAIALGPAVLFLQRGAQKIREFAFVFESDSYLAPDLSILSEHLFRNTVTDFAKASQPSELLFAVRADGQILCLTYHRPEQVVAWSHFTTDGAYRAVAVIPTITGTEDEVWVITERTLGATDDDTKFRYVEVLDAALNTDAALVYQGAPVGSVSGLDHLEGESVDVVKREPTSDPAFQTDAFQNELLSVETHTVSAGAITLDAAHGDFEVGLRFISHLDTLRPELSLATGTIQARRQRWNEVAVRFYCTQGTPLINFEPLVWPPEATFPYTGDVRMTEFGWVREQANRIAVTTQESLPCTVLGIRGALQVED